MREKERLMRPVQSTSLLVIALGMAGWGLILAERPSASADAPHATASGEAASVTPAEAMARLAEGNERFVRQKMTATHQDASRREALAKGQRPFAIVLGCADSRVPPELVFDQGLGDLFMIRVAGEVAPAEVLGSIEYAVEHLGCRAIIVLGHERCGAVEAALEVPAGTTPEGNLGELIKDILPAIEKIDRKAPDALDAAVKANANAVARTILSRSKAVAEMAHKGELVVTPARYDLKSGKVDFMEPVHAAPAADAGH
jgi:carbonic anhydrase